MLQNWKAVVISIAAAFLYLKVSAWWDTYQEQRDVYETAMTTLVAERDQAVIEASSMKAALREKEQNEERLELLLADALERQDAIRKETREQQKIFERHNFSALVEAKPGLIENLTNKATQERMNALEDTFNE